MASLASHRARREMELCSVACGTVSCVFACSKSGLTAGATCMHDNANPPGVDTATSEERWR